MSRPDSPPGLEQAILRCLRKDPRDRYANVGEFALAIHPFAPQRAHVSVRRIAGVFKQIGVDTGEVPVSVPAPTQTWQRPRPSGASGKMDDAPTNPAPQQYVHPNAGVITRPAGGFQPVGQTQKLDYQQTAMAGSLGHQVDPAGAPPVPGSPPAAPGPQPPVPVPGHAPALVPRKAITAQSWQHMLQPQHRDRKVYAAVAAVVLLVLGSVLMLLVGAGDESRAPKHAASPTTESVAPSVVETALEPAPSAVPSASASSAVDSPDAGAEASGKPAARHIVRPTGKGPPPKTPPSKPPQKDSPKPKPTGLFDYR